MRGTSIFVSVDSVLVTDNSASNEIDKKLLKSEFLSEIREPKDAVIFRTVVTNGELAVDIFQLYQVIEQ